MADAQATLDADNREAWGMYGRIVSRLTVDLHMAPVVFARAVDGMDSDEVLTLVDRLAVMHNILNPPPQKPE